MRDTKTTKILIEYFEFIFTTDNAGELYICRDEQGVENVVQFSMSLRGKPAILGEFC